MRQPSITGLRMLLLSGAVFIAAASPTFAQGSAVVHYDIAAGDLSAALNQVAQQSHREIVFDPALTRGKQVAGLHGDYTPRVALEQLLRGSGLTVRPGASGAEVVVRQAPFADAPDLSTPTATLTEVLVTAQKRSERLISVPVPVTALQMADLARQQYVSITDWSTQVPGLSITSDREGELHIVMRGVSTGFFSSPTAAIYVDDAPFGSSTAYADANVAAPDLDPAILDGVEVLRGPQGTLYGASSLGGLIKYVTRAPNLDRFSGHLTVSGSEVDGGGDGHSARAAISGPLSPGLAGLAANLFVRRDPGYINDPALGRKDINAADLDGGRLALLLKPNERLSVQVSALFQDSYSTGSSEEDLDANLQPVGGGRQQTRFIKEPYNEQERLYVAKAQYDLTNVNLLSVTSYQTQRTYLAVDDTGIFGGALQSLFPTAGSLGAEVPEPLRRDKLSEELRLSSPSGGHIEWQAGLFFTRETSRGEARILAFSRTNGNPVALGDLFTNVINSTYTEYAGFGDLTYRFNRQFDLTAGLRYSDNRQTLNSPTSGLLAGGSSLANTRSSDNSLTFLVTPRLKLDDDNMVYLRVASGYRPGGPNVFIPSAIAAGAPEAFGPDQLIDYDIGYKAAIPAARLNLELSAFDIEWRQIQLSEQINGFAAVGNGASARSSGVEVDGRWSPVAGLVLGANAAYTHAYLTAPAPGVGGRKGDDLPGVPRFAASLRGDYDFPINDVFGGFVGATYAYQGKRWSDFGTPGAAGGEARPTLGAYSTLDLRVGVKAHGATLEAYVRNLADARGLTHLTTGGNSPYTAAIIQPRTFGLSLSKDF